MRCAFHKAVSKEAARGCGGRGMLWNFNRLSPEKPCQAETLAKNVLLMLIDVRLQAICAILPPAPSVLQEDSLDACVYTRGSVRRASGFVLTGNTEIIGEVTVSCLPTIYPSIAAVVRAVASRTFL